MTETARIIVDSVDALSSHGISAISAAIGVFDGVHAGHRRLLAELMATAAATDSTPVAVTFSPHPRQVLFPDTAPALLLSPDEKYERLFSCGVKAVVVIPFTREFAALSPDRFITECLCSHSVSLKGICVGKAWRFGAGGTGNSDTLTEIAKNDGFLFKPVDEVVMDGGTVSSSTIRQAASNGDFEKASRYLTMPYAISGVVVHGFGVAGKDLKTPTANIDVKYGVIPPSGVYAAYVVTDGVRHPAVVNIGSAPTFASYGQTGLCRVEAHLLDEVQGDLYDRTLSLEPVKYLRPEQAFPSPESLKEQIGKDCQSALDLLKKERKGQEKMTAEQSKYSVIELSEQLGVKRTTVNDWLAKYAAYIEFTVQGKRRTYSANALNVLKKVAELRGRGLSSIEIDSELAKLYAIHPQPEMTDEKTPEKNMTETMTNVTETLPQRFVPQADNTVELLRQFQLIMEKLEQLEARETPSLPPPAAPPAPPKRSVSSLLLLVVFVFLAALLSAVGIYAHREMTAMKIQAAEQGKEIRRQTAENAGLRREVYLLDKSRSDFQENVKRLEEAMAKERAEQQKRIGEMEKRQKSEAELQRERFEKERLELVRQLEKRILDAEAKHAAAEKKLLEQQKAAAEKELKAQKAQAEAAAKAKAEAAAKAKAEAAAKAKAEAAAKAKAEAAAKAKAVQKPTTPAAVK